MDDPLSEDEFVLSSNLTPDMEIGIEIKGKDNFIGIFKVFDSEDAIVMFIPEEKKKLFSPSLGHNSLE